jgi:hypothetical protein
MYTYDFVITQNIVQMNRLYLILEEIVDIKLSMF